MVLQDLFDGTSVGSFCRVFDGTGDGWFAGCFCMCLFRTDAIVLFVILVLFPFFFEKKNNFGNLMWKIWEIL